MPSSQTASQWLKISITAPSILSEAAADLMGVLSGAGVELSPDKGQGCTITGFFQLDPNHPHEAAIQDCTELVTLKMGELFALYETELQPIATEVMDDQDWSTSWKQFFNTFEIIPGLVLKPSWEEFTPVEGQQVIEMDPGMAFGTGQHASTQMALSLLAESLKNSSGKTILDVGTGTGILAMAGALLGAVSVKAIDNDPDAVSAAHENAASNNLADRIAVSGEALEELEGTYDIICANIVHDVLIEMAPLFKKLLPAGGQLVLAGILAGDQEANILKVYKQLGFFALESIHTDEWAALLLQYG